MIAEPQEKEVNVVVNKCNGHDGIWISVLTGQEEIRKFLFKGTEGPFTILQMPERSKRPTLFFMSLMSTTTVSMTVDMARPTPEP